MSQETYPQHHQETRTHMNVARESRATVIRCGLDSSYSPTVRLHLDFAWDDAERARHVLRDVIAEAERRLEEIIAKVGRQ